jgi:cytidine deaminase
LQTVDILKSDASLFLITNHELITRAETLLKPYTDTRGRLHGDVGAVVVSEKGDVYEGVCVDTPGWGLCAERSAIAAMITAGEYKIAKVVGVWRDARDGRLYVLPPCGICRQFMRDVDEANLETEVILGANQVSRLRDLIPHYEWPKALEDT